MSNSNLNRLETSKDLVAENTYFPRVDNIAKIFVFNLSELRKQRGWTQEILAERAGLAHNTVTQYENGKRWPKPAQVQMLSKALGINPSRLYRDPDDPIPEPSFAESVRKIADAFDLAVKPKRRRRSTPSAE